MWTTLAAAGALVPLVSAVAVFYVLVSMVQGSNVDSAGFITVAVLIALCRVAYAVAHSSWYRLPH
jgi:hypothetical protein